MKTCVRQSGKRPSASWSRARESLLDGVDNIECLAADPGYLSRKNCTMVAQKGWVPYIKPKKNSVENAKGCWPWREMVALFFRHPRLFNRVYGLRERAEAG